jgi:hypothetical protein
MSQTCDQCKLIPQKRHSHALRLDLRGFGCYIEGSATMRLLISFSLEKRHPRLQTRNGRSYWRVLITVLGLQRVMHLLCYFFLGKHHPRL